MNAVRAIQSSFSPTNCYFLRPRKLICRRKFALSFCSSNAAEPGGPPSSEGDKRKQELLAKIAQLQAQKFRLTDYLDERSAYLTQFAEEANAEFDQVAENARKGLEEASDRIMENLESRMQAFEEASFDMLADFHNCRCFDLLPGVRLAESCCFGSHIGGFGCSVSLRAEDVSFTNTAAHACVVLLSQLNEQN